MNKLETRLANVPFVQHAADLSWEGGSYQFIFTESVKLPEYVEKFRFFLDYPDFDVKLIQTGVFAKIGSIPYRDGNTTVFTYTCYNNYNKLPYFFNKLEKSVNVKALTKETLTDSSILL